MCEISLNPQSLDLVLDAYFFSSVPVILRNLACCMLHVGFAFVSSFFKKKIERKSKTSKKKTSTTSNIKPAHLLISF